MNCLLEIRIQQLFKTELQKQLLQFIQFLHHSVFHQSIKYFRVVQVIKSLQDPLEVGNSLPGINDNVRKRGLEQKCFKR